jgi:hypothetical protein
MAKRLRDVADITRMKVCGDGRRSSVENGRTPGALENAQPFTALGCQCISRTSPGLIVTCVAATVFDTRKLVLSAIRTVPLLVSRLDRRQRGYDVHDPADHTSIIDPVRSASAALFALEPLVEYRP